MSVTFVFVKPSLSSCADSFASASAAVLSIWSSTSNGSMNPAYARWFTREKVQRSTRGPSFVFAPSSEAVARPVNSESRRLLPMPGSPAISTTSVCPMRDDWYARSRRLSSIHRPTSGAATSIAGRTSVRSAVSAYTRIGFSLPLMSIGPTSWNWNSRFVRRNVACET